MTKDHLIAELQAQVAQLKQEKEALLESCNNQAGDCAEQLELSQTLNKVSYAIRQSLDLDVILSTTVAEIRSALGVDRVIICQFDLSQGQGTVVAEAVASPDYSILGQTVSDPCIHPAFLERCGEGKLRVIADLAQEEHLTPCHRELLEKLQIRSKMLVAIMDMAHPDKIWGFLVASQCQAPRAWTKSEQELLKGLGDQIAIALYQSRLYQETQQQLLQRQQSEKLLTIHAEQQRVINRLSQLALQNNSIEQLTKHATQEIKKILAMPLVEVLELADNQAAFILKASQGWPKYLLNQKVIGMDTDSQAKYAISHNQPVMVEDFPLETRFSGSPLLHNQRVIASLMVPIIGDNKYGVLGVQSPKPRTFSSEEVQFVESIANIIAAALDKRQAQLELNHFFDLSRDLFAIVDFSGNFRRVNQSFTKILGYSIKEIHHHSFFELVHPAHQTSAEEKIHYLSLGFDSVTFESPYRCSDGVYRWLQWNMIAAGDNIFYGVGHDIEERKLAEVALRQLNEDLENRVQKRTLELKQINYSLLKEIQERKVAQQRNASIVKALGDIVYERDDQAETINWYGNHQQVLGWEENQSALNAWFDRIHPEDRPMVLAQLKQARLHQQLFDLEYRVRHYQGHYLWIHDRGVFRENPRYDSYNRILIIGVIKDITAPKRAQEALGESEERFRAIFEQTDVGMAICTLKGKFFRVNQKCSNIFGYAHHNLLQHTLLDLVYGEDQPSIQEAFTSLLQGEFTSYTSENRYLNHQQVLIWGRSHLSLIKNSANEPHYFIVVIEDITEAKEAELALKESQHFIQSITDASPNLLSIYDIESDRHIYVNRGVTKILGYTPEEIQSMDQYNYNDLIHPEDVGKLSLHYHRFTQEERGDDIVEIEYRIKDKAGDWHWFVSRDTVFARHEEGGVEQILSAASDITERKEVEERLYLSERAIEATSSGIVIADATSRTLPIIYVNPAFEQITGYSAGEVLGKHWRFLEDIEPNPKELEKLSIALREEINCTVTLRNARKDGTIFWNEFSVSPIYDRYGALTHFLGVQNDITASKEAQAKVQATKEQLQAVLDAVPGFVSWTGDDLNYLGVNRKLAEHFELHQDDFVDQPLDFVEGREPFADFITAFMAQPNLSTAQAIINSTRNGMINHYLLVSQKYNDDRSVVSVGIDITERKIVEEKLQATTTRLRSLIENLQVGILAQDHEQKVVLINETFCHLFNIESKANTLLGQDFRDFATNYQHLFADREWFQRQYEDALEQQQIISDRELALTDGRTLQMDYVPIVHDERFQGHLWMYRDISDRKLAQRKLLASLQEKEVLLKEIHHRVKNNLYVISGLLNLQSQQFSDPEICSFFNDSKNRIQTMAMIHEQLYQSGDLAQIHFEAYVQSLVRNLLVSYNPDPDNIKTEFKLKHIPIDLDMAISCGLLINELVTNSFKHAFEKGKPGKLLVEFEQLEASTLILKIADTGKGLPQDLDWEEATSLGLKLVRILTDQLDGTMELESSSAGTCFTLYFPLDNS